MMRAEHSGQPTKAAPELPAPVYNELSEWAADYELIFAPAATEQRAATRLRALTSAYATVHRNGGAKAA